MLLKYPPLIIIIIIIHLNTFISAAGWKVRAITRNPSSTKAQALASRGVEVVQADTDKPASLEHAFEGANAIFAVSDFWGTYFNPENSDKAKPGQGLNEWVYEYEIRQLKNAIDAAAKVSTLERFILSALSNATKWSNGKYKHVYHFDGKAKAVEYTQEAHPDLWTRTSVFQAGLFLSNWTTSPLNFPKKNADGVVEFIGALAEDNKIPLIAAEEDTGPLVKALVEQPAGVNLIGYRAYISPRELVAEFTKATGLEAKVVFSKGQFPPGTPKELAIEIEENFDYYNEFGYEGRADPTIVHPHDLKNPPVLPSVEDYFKKQDWATILGA
ncbi:hypothetical protein ACHAPJ_013409 [Fusarium lateritium]